MSITIEQRTASFPDPEVNKRFDNIEYYAPDFPQDQQESLYGLIERMYGLDPAARVSPLAVVTMCGRSGILEYHRFAIISHRPSHLITEKMAILQQAQDQVRQQLQVGEEVVIEPLKTLTLATRNAGREYYFLMVGIGDFRVDNLMKRALRVPLGLMIGTEDDVTRRGLRINPPEFDPVLNLGVMPGIISPFVERLHDPNSQAGIRGILFYHCVDLHRYVAIAVSLEDTLIVKALDFRGGLGQWQGHLNTRFRTVQ